jgi:hypothetical protein
MFIEAVGRLVVPFGLWLQYPYGFFASERYCWW